MNILIIGIGNPSRGDDALGPLFIERLAALELPGVELLTDFQLQVEYVLDLHGRDAVIFVDASLNARPPFEYHVIEARAGHDYTTHALPPESLLAAYQAHYGVSPPQAHVLAIRGEAFELGMPPSVAALESLALAVDFFLDEMSQPRARAQGQ